eukprot:m.219356 g.219356  ORF g.219356 m.219356 type:complete len:167 (+) comp25753_c0_seq1:2791-3291(+)
MTSIPIDVHSAPVSHLNENQPSVDASSGTAVNVVAPTKVTTSERVAIAALYDFVPKKCHLNCSVGIVFLPRRDNDDQRDIPTLTLSNTPNVMKKTVLLLAGPLVGSQGTRRESCSLGTGTPIVCCHSRLGSLCGNVYRIPQVGCELGPSAQQPRKFVMWMIPAIAK